MHPLQIGMESAAIGKTSSITTEEHGNARVAIVVDGITEHGGLQRLVHTLLLPPQLAPLKALNLDPLSLKLVPDATQL